MLSAGEAGRSRRGWRAGSADAGSSRRPRPSATVAASSSSTFRSPATMRVLISSRSHLLSSNVNASAMCLRSTSVWLM
jgi:hypothetical protein